MKISFKIIYVFILLCIAFSQKLYAAEKIKIGLLIPLSGNQSEIGKSILQSVRLAVNKIDDPNIEIKVPWTELKTFAKWTSGWLQLPKE